MELIGQTGSRFAVKKPRSVTVRVKRKHMDKTKFIPSQETIDCLVEGKNEYITSIHQNSRREQNSDGVVQEIIRVKNTPGYIGVSKSTYHNYRNRHSKYFDSSFPPLVVISLQCKGHLKHELNAWLECKKVNGTALGGDND